MAAPKALNSPGSAGRPANVESPVPQNQDIPDISAGDIPDISAGDVSEGQVAPSGQKRGLEIPSEFGSPAEAEAAAKQMIPVGADIAAGLATQVPVRAAAGYLGYVAGGPIGPITGYLAQKGAGALAAYYEKDVANAFRKVVGAPENEDRDREMDVALSLLIDIPGVVPAATKALEKGSEALGRAAVRDAISSLSPELQSTLVSLKTAIAQEMGQFLDEKAAASMVANVEKEFGDMISSGYSPQQAITATLQKYNFQARALKAQDELLNNVGRELTFEESSGGVVARPAKIIELKTDRAVRRQRIALEAVRQTKGLSMIDPGQLIDELKVGLAAAESTGNKALVDNINDLIGALTDTRKLRTASNDMAAFSEATGGKVPTFTDVETGKTLSGKSAPFPQTQEPFVVSGKEPVYMPTGRAGSLPPSSPGKPYPGSEQLTWETVKVERPGVSIGERQVVRPESEQLGLPMVQKNELTAEEHAARMLPPKLANANENRVLQSIDSLITKRINLDNEIAAMSDSPRRTAAIKAVSALRKVEDQFMLNLRNKGGDYARIADEYITSKESLASLNRAKEQMRGLVAQDAAGVAKMLEEKSVDEIKAWASVMPEETRNRVARRYVEGLIQKTAGSPERPFTAGQFNAISAALKDKVQVAKLSQLIGAEAAQSAAKDVDNLSRLVLAASKMPRGSNPERAIIRKTFKAVGDFARKYKLDFFFSGRMALPPESRYYDDFIKYIMSSDFGGVASTLKGPAEIATAASEISRVYGRNSPMTQRFYETITSEGMLPYVGGYVGAKAAQSQAQTPRSPQE